MSHEPHLINVGGFTVAGLQTQTRSSDEKNPSTSKIKTIWNRLFSENLPESLPNRDRGNGFYGVYSEYETDETGLYNVTAGVRVTTTDDLPYTVSGISVKPGLYLVFRRQGKLDEVTPQLWGEALEFFKKSNQYQRKFATDFEYYPDMNTVAIHVGIERPDAA